MATDGHKPNHPAFFVPKPGQMQVAHVTIMQEFQPRQPLYSDPAQIVSWTKGIDLTRQDRNTFTV